MRVCPRCETRFPTGERFCLHDSSVLVEEEDMARLGTLVDNYRVNTAALDPICVLQGGNYARLGEMCNRTPIHGTRNPWGNAFSEDKF